MNIKSENTVKRVKVFDTGSELIREITYQKPPTAPDWMKIPHIVIVSDEGVWSLDSQGEVIAFTANSSVKSGEENQEVQLLNYHFQNFIPLSKTDLERISIPNTSIEEVKTGVYSISNDNSKTIYDTKNLVIHTELKNQQGKLKSERSKFFERTRKGGIYPVKEMEKYYLWTRKGHKPYYRIELVDYSDYQIIEKGELRYTQHSSGNDFLSPNLVHTIVQKELTIGGADRTEGEFRVNIIGITGRVILERKYDQPSSRLTIDISHLNPGIYACIMSSDDQTVTKKFVVQ